MLVSPWLLPWLANYKRASRSGARQVLLKFLSQNGFEVRRRRSYPCLSRWAAKFSHRYFVRDWRTFRKICRSLICCFENEKKKIVFYVGISCWKYLSLYFQHTTIKFVSPRGHVISSIYIFFHQWHQSFFLFILVDLSVIVIYLACYLCVWVYFFFFGAAT